MKEALRFLGTLLGVVLMAVIAWVRQRALPALERGARELGAALRWAWSKPILQHAILAALGVGLGLTCPMWGTARPVCRSVAAVFGHAPPMPYSPPPPVPPPLGTAR